MEGKEYMMSGGKTRFVPETLQRGLIRDLETDMIELETYSFGHIPPFRRGRQYSRARHDDPLVLDVNVDQQNKNVSVVDRCFYLVSYVKRGTEQSPKRGVP
jgi:hypothetical protein